MKKLIYTCPMHPDIQATRPGKCPKCHMQLVIQESHEKITSATSYLPLIIIIGLIILVTVVLALRALLMESFQWIVVMSNFMAGFFLVFAGFKLLDLKGFAQGYSMYDLLAKKWFSYGYIYPFIELFLGLCYAAKFVPPIVSWCTFFIMLFSGLGVLIKLLRHEKFQCACLGTFLKVPLTKVTLIEDFGMALMAILMLILSH